MSSTATSLLPSPDNDMTAGMQCSEACAHRTSSVAATIARFNLAATANCIGSTRYW
jgi:hypothetical protein